MFFCAVEAYGINGDTGLATYDMVSDVWSSSGGFGNQLGERLGCALLPTFLVV
jgi:hypothetical protein